jgi:hypothetical protein
MQFHSRQQLINWLRANAPHKFIAKAIDKGPVTVRGLFKGGLVVEAGKYILGIRTSTTKIGKWVCGELKTVPWQDYVGGATPLTSGDYPVLARERKQSTLKSKASTLK